MDWGDATIPQVASADDRATIAKLLAQRDAWKERAERGDKYLAEAIHEAHVLAERVQELEAAIRRHQDNAQEHDANDRQLWAVLP